MANLKEVRTRIASVSSTQQITSAMKMVSAAKFRRAQNAIIGMRPYAAMLNEIISDVGVEDGVMTPFQEVRHPDVVLMVVITSNKGLCGAFNSNIIKQSNARLEFYRSSARKVSMITLGRKATETFMKQEGLVEANYDDMLDHCHFEDVCRLVESIMQRFSRKEIDRVELIYNQFKNSIQQIVTTEQFLPVEPGKMIKTDVSSLCNDYIFEPDKSVIMQELLPLILRTNFYKAILDSLAAEHGARMTAMQKATDNATELLKELKLTYNKVRQSAITNEIIEIVSGSEALKG